jgi:plastocyanin
LRKLLVLALALAAGLAAALAATALAATASVKVGDNYFVRARGVPTVTVSKGTKVTWRFRGDAPHNVTVKRGPARFRSSTKSSGSFSKTLRKRGTYTIYCTIHGTSDQSMKLVVR